MPLSARKPSGSIADDLPAAGVPQRERIEHRAGAERGDEAVDRATSTSRPLSEADDGAEQRARRATATGQGRPSMVCRLIARMCQSTMP